MKKRIHEIRDPIHTFIRVDDAERKAIDSRPVQRLRYIHQLAMSYHLYPAATHKRFEHSLGVMELAGRVFDVIARKADDGDESIRDMMRDAGEKSYWRRVLRLAALCHDIGHLPFSHAAEHELLPDGWNHERLTARLIRDPIMEEVWSGMAPPQPKPIDIVKLAVGPKKCAEFVRSGELPKGSEVFTDWETILSEVIVGDAFGVDRMDYLLRDAYHAGVAYGRFDHFRLIDTLCILPKEYEDSKEPALGVEEGGIHSAEALLLARYFMYTQVYFHPIRKVYDIHLQDFLAAWLMHGDFGGKLPIATEGHLRLTDNEVLTAIAKAAGDLDSPGYDSARRILEHDHFQLCYRPTAEDTKVSVTAGKAVFDALTGEFGCDNVRRIPRVSKSGGVHFPVLRKEGAIRPSLEVSEVLGHIPDAGFDFVFVRPDLHQKASEWLDANTNRILNLSNKEVADES